MDYQLEAWADGFGDWYCKVTFDFPGLGNTPEAERRKYAGLRAAKRRIREELKARQALPLAPLSYVIHANKIDQLNRLHSLTVKEVAAR
jgi:hypothetical protein